MMKSSCLSGTNTITRLSWDKMFEHLLRIITNKGELTMEQKRLVNVLAAMVVLLGVSATVFGDKIKLSEKHDGQTVITKVGDEIVLRLSGNPTTGYQWMLDDIAGKSVTPDGIIEYEPIDSDKRVGAGGFFIARFNAVKTARTAFKLVYLRPWEKDKEPAEVFLVTLDVKKAISRPVKEVEAKYLTHSNGKMEGKRSIGGSGHGVIFETPQGNQKLIAIQVFASRYGTPKAPDENFHVYLLDADGKKVITSFKYPYSRIKRGKMKWYLLKISPTRVPKKFLVALSFNPKKTKGIYLGFTNTDTVTYSRIGLPGKGFTMVNKPLEWMVRAFFQAPDAAVVKAKAAPQVIYTYPLAMSNNVDPAMKKIVVKFDRPMKPKSFSWTGGGESFPKVVGTPFYNKKLNVCTLPVKLEPGCVYWVGVNSPSYKNFQTKDSIPADRYIILFATKNADGTPTEIPPELINKAKKINSGAPLTAVQVDGEASRKLTAKGWKLWKQNKFFEAEKLFTQALKKDPKNADAWNGLGWSNMNQGKRFDARFDFNKCLAIDPKNPGALNGLGWIAKGQGKTDDAITFWKRAIASNSNATAALNGLASTSMEQKNYEQATQYYLMWLKVEPNNETAKAGLEKAREERRENKAATSNPS
jgi:predicted secreted protein